ncbi:vacuolating cytotoxin autotransporter [Helicobacter pylori]|uniref:vacuolating cytotoxin autotransporter n=3 Tax=Helicobacter pylori TaxID=210 RepID=UPI00193320E1|nr:vacuolating cytotoxin autotransporter [Helicobacter pylori]MBM0604517.1 vacuolating cytotoxin autotransporter [Helicobacter pylori]MBM0614982.1 vacuolating cytotoxin autotransporter [Helicobacter pylori]MBM0616416.1 vacuolating cytotoxin autotransporter [Helicobacter pylori]MBM0629593.1 vacuolating cytotoxin autotransporter [Helicobacter pylori]
MEIQQTHRKINRPIISLALVGVLMGTELGANTPNDPIHSESRAFFTTVIIPAIVGGIATGAAVGTVSGLLSWGLKQAEQANKAPDKPDKVWRIQAGRGFDNFPHKQYDLYKSLLSSKIDGGWDWGNAARHYWVKDGQWNKLEVDMQNAVGTYNLSGLINFTGGDLDVNMQKATLRLGQFNGNSFTSFKDSADRTTRVNFNAKNILIDNFVEINNRVGSGAGRKASSTVLTLQASEKITSRENAEISLYDGATLNLVSSSNQSVDLYGKVWMGRLQYVGAYLAPSYSTINTSKVQGEMNFRHLAVGDQNAAQAGIIANKKTNIGVLDLWQSAGLSIITPPEGGYESKTKDNPSQNNPKNDTQKTEIQPTQVIDGPFAGGKDTVVNIFHLNTKADGTLRAGGFKASLSTNAAHLHIGEGGINLSNQASGRSLLVENLTGNITVEGTLRVNNQVGGAAVAGSSANFEFKAGEDTNNATATFNNDIHLGKAVNLRVDAHTAYFNGNVYLGKSTNLRVNGHSAHFKNIDASKSDNGLNTSALDFSGVTDKVNINKLTTSATNVNVKNFDIKELVVTTRVQSFGQYTIFGENIGDKSRIGVVSLQTGYSPAYSGGVTFKSGKKLVIDEIYHAPWNYFDARNVTDVEINKRILFGAPGNIAGKTGLMFNNLTLNSNASMDYGKDLDLTIQGHFTNNQGTMNLFVQDGRVATLNAGHQASMIFNNLVDSATGFYKPLIKINNAQNLTKNKEHVLVKARNIDYNLVGVQGASYDNISASNTNLQESFKERLALYNNNNRMDICVVRKNNTDDIKACGMAIGNQSMVNNPENYKYLEGKAWKNTGINKTANNTTIAVNLGNNSTPTENGGNTTDLPTNTTNNARFASYALIKNAPFARYSATPNLVAINKHDFGTIESVFELADRSKDIDTLYTHSGVQGRDLLQTLLIDNHDAGYARTMIDATNTGEITKQLNVATDALNNVASLEHKQSGLQTLSLSNAMILNSRLVNLSRKHTNHIDSFAQRLQALKGQRFASLESAAEVLYQFAPKYEKPTNVWANAIGGASLNSGGNASLYGTSAGVDAYLNGEVEAIVGGFGSYGYSSFSNQANSLNSGANNTNFGVYSRLFANQHEFDFEAQGALGSDQSSLNFKSALLQDLNQSYHYLAYSAATRASYGYDFAFFRNALVLKPSVGVSYNHLGSTNFKSNSNQVALKNGSSSQHLFNASANVEARYYYGDTSYFYMNAGVLQEFAHVGSNNAASLNTFKINAARNPLNTHARVMMGGELELAKEVFLNLGVVYLHNLISNASHFASNLGMRYSF